MAEIPFRLSRRPRDKRGLVIPYTQFIRRDGTPDFRILDERRGAKAARQRRCSLCGDTMRGDVYFIGGPKCVEYGYFYDPPMHRECAVYSLQTCPHLARIKGRYSPDDAIDGEPGHVLIAGDMDISKKAEWFGLMRTKSFQHLRDEKGMLLIKAEKPWLTVERWQDGKVMEEEKA